MRLLPPERSFIGKAFPTVRDDVLSPWSLPAAEPYERRATIHALFSAQAARTPERTAVEWAGGRLTFAQIEARSTQLARRLASLGVAPGAAVGVAFERAPELPVALLGILKAGAAYVPLDPSYPAERLAFMCADAGVSIALTAGRPAGALPSGVRAVDLANDAPAAQGAEPLVCAVEATSLAYVTYTSGSTGRPKGVAIEHRGVVRLVRSTDYLTIGADETFLHYAPLAFDASTFDIWAPLLNGARLVVPRPGLLSMEELAGTIARFGVTALFLTTSIFQRFVDSAPPDLPSLRQLFTGGEVASPAHFVRFAAAFPSCRLIAVYGPTENTTFSTWHEVVAPRADEPIPIGRPIAHSTAYVLDERLERVPPGVEGELCVGGDGVARGYVNQPALSAARFVPDPFSPDPAARLYRTGDRASSRPDGVLEFHGRADDQVKIRGHRVEPGEIETVLRARDDVHAAVVVAAERMGDKALFAYVVPAPGRVLSERVVREHLAQRLPAYMLPQYVEIRSALPAQPSGKVDRAALARNAANRVPSPAGRGVSPAQREVAESWRAVLGSEPGPDENFFDAGGDSLALLRLYERLQRSFGASFGVTELFAHTTIRTQSAFLASLRP